ncbi:MAG: hypothetical protein JW818_00260 [Pirellulales bacterium]|nr:hypothetical protein [Pirellulales bacterium]
MDVNPYRSPDMPAEADRAAAPLPDGVGRGRLLFLLIVGYFVFSFIWMSATLLPEDARSQAAVMIQWALLFLALLAAWRGRAWTLFVVLFRCFFVTIGGLGSCMLYWMYGYRIEAVLFFVSGLIEGSIFFLIIFSKSIDAFLQYQAHRRQQFWKEMLAQTEEGEPLPEIMQPVGHVDQTPEPPSVPFTVELLPPDETLDAIFPCEHCGILLRFPGRYRGQFATCRYCGEDIHVPD